VYTGTFERYQGLDLLFESARLMTATHPEAAFVMAGARPEQSHCREEVVALVGSVPLTESVKYINIAENLVSPRTKGLSVPLQIYSYMRSGKPGVVTNIGVHTQILDDQTAIVVNPNSVALAQGLPQLVENPELRADSGRKTREMSEKESLREGYFAKLERAYHAISRSEVIRRMRSAPSIGI
jgi:glycosyltransferase involved in cell wall biosynthesis